MTSRILYPIAEVPHRLGVGRTTTYELIARGELEVVHIGRRALVPSDAIDAFVSRLRGGAVTSRAVTL